MTLLFLTIGILILIVSWIVYYCKNRYPNWVIIFLPGLISIIVIILAFLSKFTPLDTRLVEYTAEGVRHYPTWVENIYSKPCNDSVNSYPVSHHEYFAMMYKNSANREEEKEIPRGTYYYYKELWGNIKEDTLLNTRGFVRCRWPNNMYTSLIYTKTEPYDNYFKNILSLYNFKKITEKEAKELNLFPRAGFEIINSHGILEPRQTLIYGLQVSDSISRAASFVSTVDHKFRPILLVWEGVGKKEEIIEKQRSYWEGGRDNEVVFCISLNDKDRKQILWSGSFSWAATSDFENYVITSSLHPGDRFDEKDYITSLMEGYENGLWEPRDFSTYQIATLPLDHATYLFLSIIILVLDILLGVKIIQKINIKN